METIKTGSAERKFAHENGLMKIMLKQFKLPLLRKELNSSIICYMVLFFLKLKQDTKKF